MVICYYYYSKYLKWWLNNQRWHGLPQDVAVALMDTQGAWDARMSKEQSATIFGLTTLLASRLIYNVSRLEKSEITCETVAFWDKMLLIHYFDL